MADQQSSLSSGAYTQSSNPTPSYAEGNSSDDIRRDIERTRRDMDETVDELESRLRPRHLLDDVLGFFRGHSDGTVGTKAKNAGRSVMHTVTAHPIPIALIGAGVAWLIAEQRKGHRLPHRGRRFDFDEDESDYGFASRYEDDYYEPYGYEYRHVEPTGSDYSSEAIGDESDEAIGDESEHRGIRDRAREKMHHARERVSGAGAGARARAAAARERARRGYDVTREHVTHWTNDYPLAMGVAALATGLVAGLVLPHTNREDELLGDYSDRLKYGARERGRELVERGKAVAHSAADAARSEGQRQGLTPEQLKREGMDRLDAARQSAAGEKGELKNRVKAVVDAGKEAAKTEAQRQKEEFKAH